MIVNRVLRALPLPTLTNNLLRIYELFKKYEEEGYVMEVFGRDEEDITEGGEHEPDYYEMIIESGFHIYSLVTMYLETKKNTDSLDEDDEMNDYLKEFKREETTLKSTFQKSIFG